VHPPIIEEFPSTISYVFVKTLRLYGLIDQAPMCENKKKHHKINNLYIIIMS